MIWQMCQGSISIDRFLIHSKAFVFIETSYLFANKYPKSKIKIPMSVNWVDDSSGAVRVLYLKISYGYIQINILIIIKVMSALP